MANEKALAAFMAEIAKQERYLLDLQEMVENHLGKLPDEVNWATVGSAERLTALLREAFAVAM
jgi:polysaccharide deacetylase 2 family uncharacterized protein YibQ